MIRLTNAHGQTLTIAPGTAEDFAWLSVKLRPLGVRVEYEPTPTRYGLTSGRRIRKPAHPATLPPLPTLPAERPPMSPLGETLYREFTTLYADRPKGGGRG